MNSTQSRKGETDVAERGKRLGQRINEHLRDQYHRAPLDSRQVQAVVDVVQQEFDRLDKRINDLENRMKGKAGAGRKAAAGRNWVADAHKQDALMAGESDGVALVNDDSPGEDYER